jgi:hypothetical protein
MTLLRMHRNAKGTESRSKAIFVSLPTIIFVNTHRLVDERQNLSQSHPGGTWMPRVAFLE